MPTAKRLPSGSYRCRVYVREDKIKQPDGTIKRKKIYKSFTAKTKREAEYLAMEYTMDRQIINDCELTIGEAIDKYIENRSGVLSPSTIREYKRCRNKVFQEIMDIKINSITQEQIQIEINKEALNHSPKTVRNRHGLLSAVLKTYRPNFALNTQLPKKERVELYIPSNSEIETLLNFVRGSEMEIPILLAAFGPMRRGEICALDSSHVNGNDVFVEYALAQDDNNIWIKKAPKSSAGKRHILYPDFVAEKLKGIEGNITQLNPDMITKRFEHILKNAGLNHFRFHDLRHYCASAQHALGVPDAYIMERGGWENDTTLKNIYRHAMNDTGKEMNKKINQHFDDMTRNMTQK